MTSGSVLGRRSAALVGRYRLERELGAGGMATTTVAMIEANTIAPNPHQITLRARA